MGPLRPRATWLLLCLLPACSLSHKLASARHTPCKASEVEISDRQRRGRDEYWRATCPQGAFECQALGTDYDVIYRCRPAAP